MNLNELLISNEDFQKILTSKQKKKDYTKLYAQAVKYHRDKYYNDEPEITDYEFDLLFDRLKILNPKHKLIKETGSEVNSAWEKANGARAWPMCKRGG